MSLIKSKLWCVFAGSVMILKSMKTVVHDVLKRLNLSMSKVRGQCYDGASAMSGSRAGVVKMIQDEGPRAIYTHCYGHSLNLACCDMVKHCKIMNDALDITLEITKLIKKITKT